MTDEEWAWVAGLLEGEGSFYVHRGKYGRAYCAMTDLDVIEKLQLNLGGIIQEREPGPKGTKVVYAWSLNPQAQVKELLVKLYPLMGTRRRVQINTVLGVMS